MIYFLTFFDFFELRGLHVSPPGAAPVQTILPHQPEAGVTETNNIIITPLDLYYLQKM